MIYKAPLTPAQEEQSIRNVTLEIRKIIKQVRKEMQTL